MGRIWKALGVVLAIVLACALLLLANTSRAPFGFLQGREPVRTTRDSVTYSFEGDFKEIARSAREELQNLNYVLDPYGQAAPNVVSAEKRSGGAVSTVSVFKDTRASDTMVTSVAVPSSAPRPTHSRTEMLIIGRSPGWVYVRLEKVEHPSPWQRFLRLFGL